MRRESLIQLDLSQEADCVLVTSPQFPFLNLVIPTGTESELTRHVLPVLQEMVEFEVGAPVALRLVQTLGGQVPIDDVAVPPPHVLATLREAHGG